MAPHGTPPLEWSETKNIRWKVAIPGRGSATPIVWDDRVFVVTAVPSGELIEPRERESSEGEKPLQAQRFSVLAISRQNGKVLWERVARTEVPHEGKHETGTWASGSPVTDGEHVFAYFGSQGLYAFDMQGELLKHNSGLLSSFNAKTGEVNYQMRLKDVPNVYASPVGADNRVYVAGREGKTVVLEHPAFRILTVNSLEDGFDASPAVVDDEIYLRGQRFLYCISQN